MSEFKNIRILLGREGHAQTREKLNAMFDPVYANKAKLKEMPESERAQIRAIGSIFKGIDKEVIDLLPNLEIISSFGVGYDHIDAQYAGEKGVIVTHTPDVLNNEVADTTIALLLNTLRQFYGAEKHLREGKWESEGNFPLTPLSMRGRSIGIYGLGRIGRDIAKRLGGFNVPIHYHSRNPVEGVDFTYHKTLVSLAEAVDTLIVIVPGTKATERSVNADVLEALGARGVLINVGRGSVVDEPALIKALQNRTIAAAGLDVFEKEPYVPQALLDLPNACLLPHVASASEDTRMTMGQLVIDNLIDWFEKQSVQTPTPETAHLLKH